jgi:predicted Zn-dependent protease
MEKQSPLEELESHLKALTSTSIGRRAFLASVPAMLAACASAQHRQREGDNSGQLSLTVEEERKMTADAMKEMGKDYPALQNQDVQLYIRALGSKIARTNALEGKPYNYNFTVVGVPQVNAFALPAGTVFVTAPLIALSESEAELAGVVGHEIGHVKSRHVAERIAAERESNSWLWTAGSGLLGGAVGFGLGKLLCSPNDKACIAKATVAGAAAGVGGGLLIQKYKFMANSREDEMEADRVAFRTSVKTNYHKERVGDFYAKLLRMEQESKVNRTPLLSGLSDAMSTHPPSTERVNQMHELALGLGPNPRAIVNTKDFDRVKKICQHWVREQQDRANA